MSNGLALRVEDRGFQFDGDGSLHGADDIALTSRWPKAG
jgi:hypothetical protein